MIIRSEQSSDIEEIRRINIEAFGSEPEADLVEALRDSGIPLISLVAEKDDELIGHILFSPVSIEPENADVRIAGLAPMAVATAFQNREIGSKLVEEGLKRCKLAGYVAVVVLGHPNYYPKFGFIPSVKYGIKSEYDVSSDVFMVIELVDGVLAECGGIVRYHEAFNLL
ncbi:MAG: N-acetyltransferase [candidate division Zixibacteria bacterium]